MLFRQQCASSSPLAMPDHSAEVQRPRSTEGFVKDVMRNACNAHILERWSLLNLPDAWLVAGCLFQTVWNLQSERPPGEGIKDYDIFFFDANNLSAEAEQDAQQHVQAVLSDIGVEVEVCNQARVHQWYPAFFGKPYPRLHSSCDGIDRFLVLSTCVGIQPQAVYAPNGFDVLYRGHLEMNPLTPYTELYERKVASYRARWPWLTAA
jgi:uncharacterized protein